MIREVQRHPRSEIQDIYKLLYQGAFGPGHMIHSKEDALAMLENEARSMGRGGNEPLFESCRPDSGMVRVNLRPWVAGGYSLARLAEAMMQSASDFRPDTSAFQSMWAAVGEMIDQGRLRFDADEFEAFGMDMADRHYPAVHHSPAYGEAYRPAYRVVRRDVLARCMSEIR
jgi:hypothetical protein